MLTCGTADEIGDAVQPFFDAGLDGLIFNMPAGSTPEMVELAGNDVDRTLRNVNGEYTEKRCVEAPRGVT